MSFRQHELGNGLPTAGQALTSPLPQKPLPPPPQHQNQYYSRPTSQGPLSEYVPTPSQTPAPTCYTPVSSIGYPPPPAAQTYTIPPVPNQYYVQEYNGGQPSTGYYQQQPITPGEQVDPEKGEAQAKFSGSMPEVMPYVPPAGHTGAAVGTEKEMIFLFGKPFTKEAVIIVSVIIALTLIFIIGLGAGLGSKVRGHGTRVM